MENSIRILGLSLFGRQGASSRYRLYQYLPFLKEKNIHMDIYPLMKDRAYDIFMGNKKINPVLKPLVRFFLVLSAMLNRFSHIIKAGSYDAVYIQKDVLPYFYLLILKKLNRNIIFDLDDALYENHSTVKAPAFSLDNFFFKHRKNNLKNILKFAKAVTVTTPYLAEYAKKYNQNVHIITGPIDCDIYQSAPKDHTSKTTIGWIGSPVTTKYVEDMIPVFEVLQKKYPELQIHLIGAKKFDPVNSDVKFLNWSEENEISLLSELDIGIMPLLNDNWSKGKGGLKILQYFALNIPVVCSPVGINIDLVSEGVNGYLADSNETWIEKLSVLIEDSSLRKIMGKAGRNLVEQKFDLKISVDYIESIIKEVVE